MKKVVRVGAVLSALFLGSFTNSHAMNLLLNGGFEDGLNNWSVSGLAGTDSAPFGFSAYEGTDFALLFECAKL